MLEAAKVARDVNLESTYSQLAVGLKGVVD